MADNTSTFMELTASIVSAYVQHNSVPSAELPALIGQVHTALTRISSGHGEALGNAPRPTIPIKKSIAPDYIICLEDGKKFKSLKRHLRTHYNLTPEQYREKWSLGSDYPVVAPKYAAARSRLDRGPCRGHPAKRDRAFASSLGQRAAVLANLRPTTDHSCSNYHRLRCRLL